MFVNVKIMGCELGTVEVSMNGLKRMSLAVGSVVVPVLLWVMAH